MKKLLLILLLLSSPAYSYDAGKCVTTNILYSGVEFKAEVGTNLEYMAEFKAKNKGIMTYDAESELYTVVWHPDMPAPEAQYVCKRIEEAE
jgi:hypothetical protein